MGGPFQLDDGRHFLVQRSAVDSSTTKQPCSAPVSLLMPSRKLALTFLTVSGTSPVNPVVSKLSGHVYERDLILKALKSVFNLLTISTALTSNTETTMEKIQ